jgi:DNA-binding NarL/FixJ family response regulator
VYSNIKIALADDHKIFRDGVKMTLRDKEDVVLSWEADDGQEMLHKVKVKEPDVLLMDIRMPNVDGLQALNTIKDYNPDVKVIILSMYDNDEMIVKCMEAGANAFLSKTTDPDKIYKAIKDVHREEYHFNDLVNTAVLLRLNRNKSVRKKLQQGGLQLSDRETQVLQLICEDKTTDEIADTVFVSPRTIEAIRQNLKEKTGAKSVAGLVVYAMRNNIFK